ncbi:hypothetical protein D1835_13255 [Enterococcus asini]|nr:hypothetical protein [Enterococcus asini]
MFKGFNTKKEQCDNHSDLSHCSPLDGCYMFFAHNSVPLVNHKNMPIAIPALIPRTPPIIA